MQKLTFLLAAALAVRPADLVLTNARVWTGEASRPWAEAAAIEGNRVAATGSASEMPPARKTIDLKGRLVLPGFNDAHTHFLGGSLGLSQVDLTGACSPGEMQRRIRQFASAHPAEPWITGRGWEYYCFPGARLPTREDLDAAVRDRPAFLSAYDGHTGWANSKALELAGIAAGTKFSGYGEVVLDPKTGEPTGALKEGAQGLVSKLIPPATTERKMAALAEGMRLAASLGITSIQNASGDPESIALYADLARQGRLTVRVNNAPTVGPGVSKTYIAELSALREIHTGLLLRAGALKFMMDGVIESHTAAMLEPYAGKPEVKGDPAWRQAHFNGIAAYADALGFQLWTHAIGDRAVRMALDGYEHVLKTNGRHDARFRIEHVETVSPADIPRFAGLGVIASMMPVHADPATVEVWSRAVGPARWPFAFTWRSLERAGARLAFASDWPATISADPIRGIHNAVNRRTTNGLPPGGWIPAERVSVETAVRAYTTGAAYAEFAENEKGRIAKGMLADLIVVSQDLFRIDPMRLHETKVEMTIFDGKVIYEKNGPTARAASGPSNRPDPRRTP